MASMNVCAVRMLCVNCGMGCGLPVDFRWAVNTWLRIGAPEAYGGAYVGVVWPIPSGPASGPLWCCNRKLHP